MGTFLIHENPVSANGKASGDILLLTPTGICLAALSICLVCLCDHILVRMRSVTQDHVDSHRLTTYSELLQ